VFCLDLKGDTTYIAILFSFLVQNFAKIEQLTAELWPKNDFQHGGRPPY